MFFEIIIFIFFGIVVGILTGLVPGLHPNTIYIILLSFVPFLEVFGIYAIISFVVSVAVTNTFIDFIPSLIFGAPEEGSELSVLPGHKMLMKGRGYEALYLTVYGGVLSTLLMIISLPVLIWITPIIYEFLKSYVHLVLIAILVWMLLSERGINRFWALVIFLMSGFYGIIVFSLPSSQEMIFPALSGMFGLSTLILSVKERTEVPPQKRNKPSRIGFKGPVTGWLSGMLVGLLPGVGSSQAGMVSAQIMKTKMRDFVSALGGINTSNIIFTLVVLFTISKTRSGLAIFVSQITEMNTGLFILIVPVALISALVAGFMTLKIGWLFLSRLSMIDYATAGKIVIAIVSVLVIALTGLYGALICMVGVFIGIFCIQMNIRRSYMMGFFMLTVILFFMNMGI
ncbi:MAG: tripartite tricarboxylate transporter permease [Candidatus Aenigmarchaeota archaeon]|nr:tripartite tricarboxylate transporter permease [Candidatus Aenigmarchaeota archaeon]